MANEKRNFDEFRALVKAANEGKLGAAQKLREYVGANEWALRLSDLSILVMDSLMGKMVKDAANRELLAAQVAERKRQMGYAEATGVEQMLIERVMMCWLRVIADESRVNNSYGSGVSLKQCDYAERSLSRAHSRFLRACEALERYRAMAQITKIAKAKAELLDAKAGEARMNKSNAAIRLLKSATG
jgi:hypothetical protein